MSRQLTELGWTQADAACEYLKSCALPVVVKADGLAAGKGVVIAHSHAEAQQAARAMLSDKVFGAAGESCIWQLRAAFLHVIGTETRQRSSYWQSAATASRLPSAALVAA